MYCMVGHFASLAELIAVRVFCCCCFVGFLSLLFWGLFLFGLSFFFVCFLRKIDNIAVNWYVSSREFSIALNVSWCVCEACLPPSHVQHDRPLCTGFRYYS